MIRLCSEDSDLSHKYLSEKNETNKRCTCPIYLVPDNEYEKGILDFFLSGWLSLTFFWNLRWNTICFDWVPLFQGVWSWMISILNMLVLLLHIPLSCMIHIWEEICWPYGASFRCHIFCIFEHLFWQLRGVWCQNLQHFLKIYECHMVYMPLFGPLLHRGPF